MTESAAGAVSGRAGLARDSSLHVLAIFLLVSLTALLGWSVLHFRPDLAFGGGFVTGEDGNQLWRADQILRGRLPYRDFALQYGFLPSYVYAAFAGAFGNTLLTCRAYHLAFSVVCVVLSYLLVRRSLGPKLALVVAVAFIPILLAPGGTIGANTNVEYIPVERVCFLALMLLWTAPDRRTVRGAIALGLVLGLWQAIKFGGAIFAGLSVVLVDLAWLLYHGQAKRLGWLYARRLVATGVTFLLLQGLWLAIVFGTTPRALAVDAVWPVFIADAYKLVSVKYPGVRYPAFAGIPFLLSGQWLPLSCGLLGLFGCAMGLRRRARTLAVEPASDAAAWPLLIGMTFYLVAWPVYFGHVYLWYQYCWLLLPAGAWGLARLPRAARGAVLASWLPTWLLMLKITFVNAPDPHLVAKVLPNTESVYLSAKERAELEPMIELARAAEARGRFVLALYSWGGGGFHFFYDREYGLRNYLVDQIIFRPSDASELARKLPAIDAIGPLRGHAPDEYLDGLLGQPLRAQVRGPFSLLRSPSGEPQALVRVP